jgi:glycosyltransferase involved in cell wall biosynthesis
MKVYYVAPHADGCYYYRCYLPMYYNNWGGTYLSMTSEITERGKMTSDMMASDIIVFHRPSLDVDYNLALLLKSQGKKIVFENDDTYKVIGDEMNFADIFRKQNANLEKFMALSDLCTTTTEFLKKEYEKINKTVVLPNYIDPNDWAKPQRNDSDILRVGFVGSVSHNKDYENIKPLLKRLAKRRDVKIVVMGMRNVPAELRDKLADEIAWWDSINAEWVESVPNWKYPRALNSLKLDVMLIPRLDSYFNKAKSNCKYLEASMCEIPVIAQSFDDGLSPYDGLEHIKLANGIDEWEKSFSELEDKNTRLTMGRKARQFVVENYNIADHYKEWEEAYKTIYEV